MTEHGAAPGRDAGTDAGTGAGTGTTGARIVDRGYQHYAGARGGVGHATWVMMRAAMQRSLGIRRPPGVKILPWTLILLSFAPAVVLLGLQFFIRGGLPLPGYGPIYARLTIPFLLFAGLIAPDLLCQDRRERVLALYFAAPITRLHYVGAQLAGLMIVLLLLTLVPQLILFAGSALLAPSAADYVGHHRSDLWLILLAGALFALCYGAVAMAVASFTDRRAYAAGAFLALLLVDVVAVGILVRILAFRGHEWITLFIVATLPLQAANGLFGTGVDGPINAWAYLGAALIVVVVSVVLLVWRYLRIAD